MRTANTVRINTVQGPASQGSRCLMAAHTCPLGRSGESRTPRHACTNGIRILGGDPGLGVFKFPGHPNGHPVLRTGVLDKEAANFFRTATGPLASVTTAHTNMVWDLRAAKM